MSFWQLEEQLSDSNKKGRKKHNGIEDAWVSGEGHCGRLRMRQNLRRLTWHLRFLWNKVAK